MKKTIFRALLFFMPFFPFFISCSQYDFPPNPKEIFEVEQRGCEFAYEGIHIKFRSNGIVKSNPYDLVETLLDHDLLNLDDSLLSVNIATYTPGITAFDQITKYELLEVKISKEKVKEKCFMRVNGCEKVELTEAVHTMETMKINIYDLLISKGIQYKVFNEVDSTFFHDPILFKNPFNWNIEIDGDLSSKDIFSLPNGKEIQFQNKCNC